MLQQIFSLSFMTAFLAAAVRLAVPLMYGGIGETIAEKSAGKPVRHLLKRLENEYESD